MKILSAIFTLICLTFVMVVLTFFEVRALRGYAQQKLKRMPL